MSIATSSPPRLVRALGPMMAMAVVIGTIIGSGIFKKPQQVAENVPYFGLAALAWILGGLLALLGALALAEVAVLYPRAGGNYVYLREGYGRLAGFLWGWVDFWIIRGASLAALATIFTESLRDVLANQAFCQLLGLDGSTLHMGPWQLRGLTVLVILSLALVNIRGVRWGGLLQLLITLVKIGSLLAIMALPFLAGWFADPTMPVPAPQSDYLQPAWPESWSSVAWGGFGTALLGILWAYHGWMNLAPVAEEVTHPNRNLPLAFLGGTAVVIFLYLGANLAYYLIIPRHEMAAIRDTTVATIFSERLLGPIGVAAASAAVMFSTFGALNGNLLVGPRLLYAMGEDGLAPRALSAVHARYRTPALAIAVMALWAAILVVSAEALKQTRLPTLLLGSWELNLNVPEDKPLFDILTAFAMFGAIVFETLAVATIFIFRRRLPEVARPYRCPGYPLVPALYVMILSLVLANMFFTQVTEALVGLTFIAVGACVYYGRGLGRLPTPAPETSPTGIDSDRTS